MAQITDFNCTYNNAVGISPEVTKKLNLQFPDAYLHADTIVEIAKEVKEVEGLSFCELPFCHTLEAEAMGGIITLGDAVAGPRAKEYICTTLEELMQLPTIDCTKGRIAQNLEACKILKEQGQTVVFNVTGPFTMLNVLMDARYVFRILRKNPEGMMQVFEKLGEEALKLAKAASEYGADIISYADSSGGLNILGPKNMEYVTNNFTAPYLKKLEELLDGKSQLFLCPKTTFALLGCEQMEWEDIEISGPMNFVDACLSVRDKAAIVGQTCLKNAQYVAKNSVKAIKLKV